MGFVAGPGNIGGIARTPVEQHLLQRTQVLRRQLPVAAQLVQRDVVPVLAKVGACLESEAFVVGADVHPTQLDGGQLTELVLQAGVDDGPLGLLDQRHQAAG